MFLLNYSREWQVYRTQSPHSTGQRVTGAVLWDRIKGTPLFNQILGQHQIDATEKDPMNVRETVRPLSYSVRWGEGSQNADTEVVLDVYVYVDVYSVLLDGSTVWQERLLTTMPPKFTNISAEVFVPDKVLSRTIIHPLNTVQIPRRRFGVSFCYC